jgi:Protein of unknown function (DUF2846)
MKKLKLSVLLFASVLNAPLFAQEVTPSAPVAPTAVAAPDAISEAIGSPEAGKALVVFFRPSAFKGGAINFKVREGEVELGRLRSGNYFTLQVAPGKHEYTVHAENEDVTTIEAEDGETYFIAGEVNFGFMSGRPNLSPSTIDDYKTAFPKLKKSKPLED